MANMVHFDPVNNCVEAFDVSGHVDIFIDGEFFSRCNFSRTVKLHLMLNSNNTSLINPVPKVPSVTDGHGFENVLTGQMLPHTTKEVYPAPSFPNVGPPPFRDTCLNTYGGPSLVMAPPVTSHVGTSSTYGGPSLVMTSDVSTGSSYQGSAVPREEVLGMNHQNDHDAQSQRCERASSPPSGNEDEYVDYGSPEISSEEEDGEDVKNEVNHQSVADDANQSPQPEESASDERKCHACGKEFTRRRQMLAHGRNPDCVVKCSVCDKKFLSAAMYFIHFCKRHPNVNPRRQFKEYVNITRRIKWRADGERVKCPLCLKMGKKSKLLSHLEGNHFKDLSYVCCVCDKSFYSEKQWRQHSLTHGVPVSDSTAKVRDSVGGNGASLRLPKEELQDSSDDEREESTVELNDEDTESNSGQAAHSSDGLGVTVTDLLKDVAPENEQEMRVSYNVVTKEEVIEAAFNMADGVERRADTSGKSHGRSADSEQRNVKRLGNKKRTDDSVAQSGQQSKSYKGNNCEFCGKWFPSRKAKESHRLNPNWKLNCITCSAVLPSKGSLFEHYCREHPTEQDLKEQFGDQFSFVNLKMLKDQGVCPLCMAPVSEDECVKHLDRVHFNNQLYLCCVCGEELRTERAWYEHCDNEHGRVSPADGKQQSARITVSGKRVETSIAAVSHVRVNGPGSSFEFQCKYCKKTFSSRGQLLAHSKRKMFTKVPTISCKLCKKRFHDQASLIVHEMKRHNESMTPEMMDNRPNSDVECPVCKKVVKNATLIYHIRQLHTGETMFVCCVCGRGIQSFGKYKRHCEEKHTEVEKPKSVFKCSLCPYVCQTFSEFNRHKATHKKTCRFCGETFPLLRLAQQHYEEKHPEMLFPCSHCDRKFPSLKHLETHEKYARFHRLEPCPKCGVMLRCLKSHMKSVHSEIQGTQCSVCGKTLKNEKSLGRHMERHKNDQLACPECSKVFNNQGSLARHLTLVHFAGQVHTCHVCGKSFARRCTLKYHERIHSATKMFSCPLCNQGFNYKVSLLTHVRSKHSGYELGF
ncbi:zinc finger protein 850 isoform X1 [Aplysia californica]|uniref:Zinc finger protein 850 isoform X1 n=1 Tax=Aplysia californica TaxID=6500 RepID=A0ABM0JFC3_APLCA|nr:zinc finger protein 850 isoform X1 [Aplysia californica]XP_012934685.1 zinc finger protein 850 isoform X1 [Aplysia californica]